MILFFEAKDGETIESAKTRPGADCEWFYEDLQDLLETTPPKYVLFIIVDWDAKVGIQEIYAVTG